MNLTRLATHHIKPILFSVAVLCLFGLISYKSFPVSILPDVTFPRVVVIADVGDQPASMIEAAVTKPIEDAVTTVPGVLRIRSQTKRGSTEISIDFDWGVDVIQAEQQVNARVGQVRPDLPQGTKTETERMNPTVFPVVGLTLNSTTLSPSQLYTLAQYTLRPRLARVQGVARVVVQGGRIPEVEVVCDPKKLEAMKLSLDDVNQALMNSNIVRAVGRMDHQFLQFQVLVDGLASDVDSLKQISIAQRNGVSVRLADVAKVDLDVADRNTVVSADGKESVLLNIIRQPQANSVSMADGVRSEIASLKSVLPRGTTLGVFYDQSILVREAIQSVGEAVAIGGLLAVFVLIVFLRDARATILTSAIIPVTVLVTFLFMRMSGLTLNLMTLGALAVGIGLVIDDAIVVVENVFKHLRPGASVSEVVSAAAGEISKPMISSTLTTVVVFLPLSLLQGVAGAFFTALAFTLTIALIVSLGLALMASPALCAAFLRSREEHAEPKGMKAYEKLIGFFLKRKYLVPICGLALLVGSYLLGTKLNTGFMPNMDEGAFILDYKSDPGTSLAETNRLLTKVDAILQATPGVADFSRRTGTELGFSITETNRGDYAVMLKPNRKRGIDDVIADVRKRVQEQVPGLDIDFSQVLQDLIGDLSGSPAPIEVKIFGEDQKSDESIATDLADRLGKHKGLVDILSGVTEEGPQYVLKVNPIAAGRANMTPSAIADQANEALFGSVATNLFKGDRQIPVRVRYPFSYWSDPLDLETTPIQTPSGATVPLSTLGAFQIVPGTSEGFRENQRRMVDLTANMDGIDLGSAIKIVKAEIAKTPLPPGTSIELGGAYKSQQESFANLLTVLMIGILLVYTVMVFQFGSFTAPTVILLVMPLGLFGAVLALYITGIALNVSSFMGAIMLVGVVVKNGILLLDRAQEAERQGMAVDDAVIDAAKQRLRPILMTTLTAILGLTPLALGLGAGAEMQQPLAVTVIGGLVFSTVVTLIFSPTLYAAFRGMAKGKKA